MVWELGLDEELGFPELELDDEEVLGFTEDTEDEGKADNFAEAEVEEDEVDGVFAALEDAEDDVPLPPPPPPFRRPSVRLVKKGTNIVRGRGNQTLVGSYASMVVPSPTRVQRPTSKSKISAFKTKSSRTLLETCSGK